MTFPRSTSARSRTARKATHKMFTSGQTPSITFAVHTPSRSARKRRSILRRRTVCRAPKPDVNNFAPRLGFAYDPTGRGKWAIRGGAGFAYDVTPNNFAINSLPPQRQTEQKPAVTCALPGAPAWCLTWKSNLVDSGQGFLQGGGLLQVNVPPTTQLAA